MAVYKKAVSMKNKELQTYDENFQRINIDGNQQPT